MIDLLIDPWVMCDRAELEKQSQKASDAMQHWYWFQNFVIALVIIFIIVIDTGCIECAVSRLSSEKWMKNFSEIPALLKCQHLVMKTVKLLRQNLSNIHKHAFLFGGLKFAEFWASPFKLVSSLDSYFSLMCHWYKQIQTMAEREHEL